MKRLFHILFGKVSGRFDFFWLGGLAQKSTLPQHRDRDLFLSIKHITVPLRGTVICFILLKDLCTALLGKSLTISEGHLTPIFNHLDLVTILITSGLNLSQDPFPPKNQR